MARKVVYIQDIELDMANQFRANTSAQPEQRTFRRGIECAICGGPVPLPRYRYCGDDCAAQGQRQREANNSREYRKRKKKEAQKGIEAKYPWITGRGAS